MTQSEFQNDSLGNMKVDDRFSAKNFLRFIRLGANRGLSESSKKNYLAAAKRALKLIEKEDFADLRKVDMNRLSDDFSIAYRRDLSESTIKIYWSSVRLVMTSFYESPITTDFEEKELSCSKSIQVVVPIRDGVTIKIEGIPIDLTEVEAKKVSAIMNAYATGNDR